MSSPPTVLVIGGGFAGMVVASELASKGHSVTLVSKTDYFEIAFANARAIVEPGLVDKTLLPYTALKRHGTFVRGEVVKLTDTSATLADGQTLQFDFAAICSGTDYAVGKSASAVTLAQRKEELQALSARMAAAKSVLIVGGGPLGVELAGEVLTDCPGKTVTLVHGGSRLLPTLPQKLGAAAHTWLTQRGCKVILNDKLDAPASSSGTGPFSGTTAQGVALSADLLLLATGVKYNSGFMAPALADAVDAQGRIKVDKQLRVVGHPTLFAVGDVTDVDEEKLAFLAGQQGALVAASLGKLLAAHAGSEAALAAAGRKLGAWKPSAGVPVIFVTLGRNYGVGRIACLTFTGLLPTLIKSRNVATGFVDKYRRQLMAR